MYAKPRVQTFPTLQYLLFKDAIYNTQTEIQHLIINTPLSNQNGIWLVPRQKQQLQQQSTPKLRPDPGRE